MTITPDIRAFMEKTGQLHLLEGIQDPQEATEKPPSRLAMPFSGVPGLPTADSAPEVRNPGKKRRQMNETEREFSLFLETLRQQGKIAFWEYEAITLRWGVLDVLAYTPDFVIFDSIEVIENVPHLTVRFIEVKGKHIRNRQAGVRTFKEARNKWHGIFQFEMFQKTKEEGWKRIL